MYFYSEKEKGFFSSHIHGDSIPDDSVEISAEDYRTLNDGLLAGKRIVSNSNGGIELADAPESTLDELLVSALVRVNAGYTAALAAILDQYPDAETLSFDKQEREARTWGEWQEIGGTEPATPYLDAMLAERPIGKGELVTRILAKADAFVAAHGNATGRRQRLEDDIKAARQAEDRAALEAIDW